MKAATFDAVQDCPDCGAIGSVRSAICDWCLADLGEHPAEHLRPAGVRVLDDLRFGDVLAELRAVADLAAATEEGASMVEALTRVEQLLEHLRAQFLRNLGVRSVGSLGVMT